MTFLILKRKTNPLFAPSKILLPNKSLVFDSWFALELFLVCTTIHIINWDKLFFHLTYLKKQNIFSN